MKNLHRTTTYLNPRIPFFPQSNSKQFRQQQMHGVGRKAFRKVMEICNCDSDVTKSFTQGSAGSSFAPLVRKGTAGTQLPPWSPHRNPRDITAQNPIFNLQADQETFLTMTSSALPKPNNPFI